MTSAASPPVRFAPGSWPDGPPPLRPGRAHEASGPSARAFAAALIGAHAGPALWVMRPRLAERLDPYGLARFFDPGRLILVETNATMDVFWALEEALRSGAASVAVGESLEPAGLTIGRRRRRAAADAASPGAARKRRRDALACRAGGGGGREPGLALGVAEEQARAAGRLDGGAGRERTGTE